MKTIKSTAHTTDILSLQDFCEACKKVYDIKTADIDAILNAPNGWTKLADLWDEYDSGGDMTPLFKAVSYIKYAYDFKFYCNLDKPLLLAVCRELCSDSPAGHAWRAHPFFARVLKEATPEDDHEYCLRIFNGDARRVSGQHCYYLEQRMMLRYWQSEGICEEECDAASRYITAYEKFIVNLCPEAASWTPDYWVDIAHICDALQYEYGSNYRFTLRDYDILISLFRIEISTYALTSDREHDYIRCVFNLKHLPLPWAQALWSDNAEKTIIKLYYQGKHFVDNDCAFEDILWPCRIYDVDDHVFSHSWIYSVVQNWIETGELHTRYEKEYKRAMFEIDLGI